MSEASDKFNTEAEETLATGCYTAQEFLQIISHVTEKSFEEWQIMRKINKILKMMCPLWSPMVPSNALKSNALRMRQTV